MPHEPLFRTDRFTVERVRYQTPDGQSHERAVVRHPPSVVLIPLLPDNRVCLIRNYRPALGRTLIELPAGTCDPGEEPQVTAARELIEETGYRAGHWRFLRSFYPAPGILDEHMHLFEARDLAPGPAAREAYEAIENFIVSRREAREMVERGEIIDAKSILGILLMEVD